MGLHEIALSVWGWIHNADHLLTIGVVGTFAAQAALKLPKWVPYRDGIVRALHGLFPSPQVFQQGAVAAVAKLDELLPLLEPILNRLVEEKVSTRMHLLMNGDAALADATKALAINPPALVSQDPSVATR